jgi:hypothetical protein
MEETTLQQQQEQQEPRREINASERLNMARDIARGYAAIHGTVNSRSIRPILEDAGLLGGDERWIGNIFRSREFRKTGEIPVDNNTQLRRSTVSVFTLAASN